VFAVVLFIQIFRQAKFFETVQSEARRYCCS